MSSIIYLEHGDSELPLNPRLLLPDSWSLAGGLLTNRKGPPLFGVAPPSDSPPVLMGEKLADLGLGRLLLLLFLISLMVTGRPDACRSPPAAGLGLNSLVVLGAREALGVTEALLEGAEGSPAPDS